MISDSDIIETKVVKKITPTTTEKKQIKRVIEILKEQVIKEIKKTKIPITIELVGSIAKDTYIRTSIDIDLFLVFPTTVSREILQEKALTIGRAILEQQEECFAEHPYVRGVFQSYKTELVPCYKIEFASQKLSAVDRTPLHTRYVNKYLKESQKKEVRIFKQFLKGIGCYGAEAEIEGFSGYLCEIMIIKYKTFQQLVENAQYWRHGETLALEKGTFPLFETPLTFIDPVDSERNVASALSKDKFELFINACKEYTKKPRLTFFFPNELKPWSLEKIKKVIGTRVFVGVKLRKPEIISENLYPQVRKAVRSIRELCKQYEFTIIDATFSVEKTNVYIVLHPKTIMLSKTVLHAGPPVMLKKNTDEFIQKWSDNPRTRKKPFEKNKRLYVEIERDYINIQNLLEDQIKHLSLGKHIDLMIRKGFMILDHNDLLTENLRLFWTTYLDKRTTWER
jgi:tRNA nucleotidyltransferase (CCA-adding enzyme)